MLQEAYLQDFIRVEYPYKYLIQNLKLEYICIDSFSFF